MFMNAIGKTIYIILGCMFLDCDETYIKETYIKNNTSVSNTVFERRLFEGFKKVCGENVVFFGAPSVGWFPKNCKKLKVRGFTKIDNYYPVEYNASYLFSSFSKKRGFTKEIKKFFESHEINETYRIIAVACEMHLPYLKTIKYLKRNFKNVSTVLFVPDLPDYNNRSSNFIYKILKKININSLYKTHEKYVDIDVLFSKEMKRLDTFKSKETIINEGLAPDYHSEANGIFNKKKRIVYIGKLDKRNGIELISKAADLLPEYSFEVYGMPASDGLPKDFTFSKNVLVHGFVSPSLIPSILNQADILLSPRYSSEEYTAFSFPSKMFDYLNCKKPIVTFKLDCYPEVLDNIFIYPKSENLDDFISAIKYAADHPKVDEQLIDKFLKEKKSDNVVKRIIAKLEEKENNL